MSQFGAPGQPPMRPAHIPGGTPRDDRRYWWVPATVSTGLSILGLMVCFAAMVLSAFATDSCNGRDTCPRTYGHLDIAEMLVLFGVLAMVGQWVPAYWSPWVVRIGLAILPIVLIIAAVAMFLTTPAGS
ncbi:hypothetical protein [Nocardia sp. CDC160]|uniref:hypothetical protein n=1 Tax=Nocardia sp. CDC160 TaxID=3112166 RepID=UPI002DBCB577|nr:hypothetical protein [Nocardia sp. CDC160]MEC3913402.1 hypothetical protein [Nocardia sp. CDC160]